MRHDIFKICADSLRTFSKEKYGIKLKAAHAHELAAAFFGYRTKNSMLADTKYPITNLGLAEIVVAVPDEFIHQRRTKLQGLSSELPDSYTLSEAVYASLFSDEWWSSENPPFRSFEKHAVFFPYRSFEKLAVFLAENNDAYQAVFNISRNIPIDLSVDVQTAEDSVLLTVIRSFRTSSGEILGDGKVTIDLPRVSGRIGYGKPNVSVERWSAGARKTFGALGVQS